MEHHSLADQINYHHRKCEQAIARALQSQVRVGAALKQIRDRRLFRESHKDFYSYCQERWDMSQSEVDALIRLAPPLPE